MDISPIYKHFKFMALFPTYKSKPCIKAIFLFNVKKFTRYG